jgi:CBS domain-containing protein
MDQGVRELMVPDPVCLPATTTVSVAATTMRDACVGYVLVQEGGNVCGIVTDRDIVVRVVAEQQSPEKVTLGDICNRKITGLSLA